MLIRSINRVTGRPTCLSDPQLLYSSDVGDAARWYLGIEFNCTAAYLTDHGCQAGVCGGES